MTKRDPNVIQNVKENVNHVVDSKNKEITQLHFEIGKIRKVCLLIDDSWKNISHNLLLLFLKCKFFSFSPKIPLQAYKDLSNAFKAKLVEYGIPLEEMGLPYYTPI